MSGFTDRLMVDGGMLVEGEWRVVGKRCSVVC